MGIYETHKIHKGIGINIVAEGLLVLEHVEVLGLQLRLLRQHGVQQRLLQGHGGFPEDLSNNNNNNNRNT